MTNKIIIWGFVTILTLFIYPYGVIAAKVLPRFQKQAKTSGKAVASGIGVRPSLRADHRALNVYFSNLSKAKTVSYLLIYQSNGEDRGVGGSIDISAGDSVNRELLFGTESSGVYHFDENISSMKLEITTQLPTGKKTLKRFRIRL